MSAVHDTGHRMSFKAWFQGIQYPKVQAVLEWDAQNREKTQWKPSAWTLQSPDREQAEVRSQGLIEQDEVLLLPQRSLQSTVQQGSRSALPSCCQCHSCSVAGTEDSALLRGQSPVWGTTLIQTKVKQTKHSVLLVLEVSSILLQTPADQIRRSRICVSLRWLRDTNPFQSTKVHRGCWTSHSLPSWLCL